MRMPGKISVMVMGGAAILHALSSPALAAPASESVCRSHAGSLRDSESSLKQIQACCQQIQSQAPLSLRDEIQDGSLLYRAALQWGIACVDQYRWDPAGKKPPSFIKRHVIAGALTRLSPTEASALKFGPLSGKSASRPSLYVAQRAGSAGEEVLSFHYGLNGDIAPDREMRLKDAPKTQSIAIDPEKERLALLGEDGSVRWLSLFYNDRSLNELERPRVDVSQEPLESMGASQPPLAIVFSQKLKRAFVLTARGEILVLDRDQPGKAKAESVLRLEGLENPRRLSLKESAKEVVVSAIGSDGAALDFTFPLLPSSTSPDSLPPAGSP